MRSSQLVNEVSEWRNCVGVRKSIGEIVPQGDPELSTGPLQAHEGIPTAPPQVTSGPATDLAFLDGIAKIPFTPIGVQHNVWPVQYQEQLRFVALDPPECLVQGLKARLDSEEGIKASLQVNFLLRRRMLFVGLQVSIQLPELTAHLGELLPVCRVEGNKPVNESLGMNPTQAMTQDLELPGIVAYDGQLLREARVQHTAQQGALGGNAAMPLLGNL